MPDALTTLALVALAAAPAPEPSLPRITLEQAVSQALARNVQSLVAAEEVARAEALVEQARAPSFPTLLGNGTYTRLDAERTPGAGQNQVSGNVTAAVPVVAPQRWMQWSRAAENAKTTRAAQEDMRRQVANLTARAFLTVVSQRRVVEVNERARDTARAHLEFARARRAGGVGNRLDEVRAEQELNISDAQSNVARTSLIRAQEALGSLIGAEGRVDADEPTLPEPPPLDAALKDARTLRTDLKLQEARRSAAQRSAAGGWTDYLPLLSAVFQPFYQNPPSLLSPPSPEQPLTGWQAQLVLSVPFYDGGLRYGQQHEREAVARQAQLNLEGALRQASSDVRSAFEAVQHADAGLKAARAAAQLSREALELSNISYRAGATTNLEVIDAERRARDAETSAAVAEDTARQARLELLVASGHFP